MRTFDWGRNDLNGVEFRKLSNTQAKYLHEKAKILQAKQSPRNGSLNNSMISLNVDGEMNNFRERREIVEKRIDKEKLKLNNPLWRSDSVAKSGPKKGWTYRNGFRKIVRQGRTFCGRVDI
jgi:hypothetical protein